MAKKRDPIHRTHFIDKSGHRLSFFFNEDTGLLVVDVEHKNGKGGNEIIRRKLDVPEMMLELERALAKEEQHEKDKADGKPFDVVGFIMDAESGECSEERMIEGVQHMIDDGSVWSLQGTWGRLAASMIEQGLCHKRAEQKIVAK